jgi:acyl-coenzyme A thioesterase PaaI-like protein
MSTAEDFPATGHLLSELGFAVRRVDDHLEGDGQITPEMLVPGADQLRASVLTVWADMIAGMMAAQVMTPRVPVTFELDLQLYRPAPSAGAIRVTGETIKSGRSIYVARTDVTADGAPLALAYASFMAAPDPRLRMPPLTTIDLPRQPSLAVPLAERAGSVRVRPGVAQLTRRHDGLNSSNTVNGGLIALAAEEAALSLADGRTLCSVALRYLQPVRVGPAVAEARFVEGLGQVEIRDAGATGRLAAVATARLWS